jgi:tetratricopeptide (TPR) repeat protein
MVPLISSRRRALSSLAVTALLGALVAVPVLAAKSPPAATTAPSSADVLARAREKLEIEDSEAALALLEPELRKNPKNAAALLLRSEALFMSGDLVRGKADLAQALALDQTLRQGWLDLAAVLVSEKNYPAALEAMQTARSLDPTAPENDLNIGAVQLLAGQLPEASKSFAAYLGNNQSSAEASFLVASNYALAGYTGLAIQHLQRAIELDERTRVRVRIDANFEPLRDVPQLVQLLSRDSFVPAPGSYAAARTYDTPYQPNGGPLLAAVLDVLQLANEPFDPNVEITAEWALVWGTIRIKMSNGGDGKGRIELSAPPTAMKPEVFQARADKLLFQIGAALALRTRSNPG